MKPIFVFNAEHDMALANGDHHFVAPQNIREMTRDLAPLMEVMTTDRLTVWGWDRAVTTHLLKQGIAPSELPTEEALTRLRNQSERHTAHHLLRQFREQHSTDTFIGESLIVHTFEEIAQYAAQHGHTLLKAPLSGSGKGLRHVNVNEEDINNGNRGLTKSHVTEKSESSLTSSLKKVKSWAEALIQRHGYLTAEPYYDKIQDFAMEFRMDAEGCHFIGYSLFNTDRHGRYIESLLMSDEAIEEYLTQYLPTEAYHEVRKWIIDHWQSIIPSEWDTSQHPLYFGIDMMIVNNQQSTDSKVQKYKLHPCVEINLRLNMGIIAHELYRQRLVHESKGVFRLAFFPDTPALRAFSHEQAAQHPTSYREGRLQHGYLPLTPINEGTRHHAYIICE